MKAQPRPVWPYGSRVTCPQRSWRRLRDPGPQGALQLRAESACLGGEAGAATLAWDPSTLDSRAGRGGAHGSGKGQVSPPPPTPRRQLGPPQPQEDRLELEVEAQVSCVPLRWLLTAGGEGGQGHLLAAGRRSSAQGLCVLLAPELEGGGLRVVRRSLFLGAAPPPPPPLPLPPRWPGLPGLWPPHPHLPPQPVLPTGLRVDLAAPAFRKPGRPPPPPARPRLHGPRFQNNDEGPRLLSRPCRRLSRVSAAPACHFPKHV